MERSNAQYVAIKVELMMDPDLSIIVPCYNDQQHIVDCINSIYNQNIEDIDFEVLVCDDGSVDNTTKILENLAIEHEEIRILSNNKNRGINYTLQRLIENSESKNILRIDADCILKPDTVETIYRELRIDCDLVFGRIDVLNTEYLHPAVCQFGKQKNNELYFGGGCVGMRKKKIVDSGGIIESGSETQELIDRGQKNNWKIRYLENVGVESSFPTNLYEIFKRKYRNTQIDRYLQDPESFSVREIRGPLFWTGLFVSTVFGLYSVDLLRIPVFLFGLVFLKYMWDSVEIVRISGRVGHLLCYPIYKMVSGVLRTAGLYRNLPGLLELLAVRYLGFVLTSDKA